MTREQEYLADLDHYDEGMGIHSSSYEKCKERLIKLAIMERMAMFARVWVKKNGRNKYCTVYRMTDAGFYIHESGSYRYHEYSEYKKTFWLTGDEVR